MNSLDVRKLPNPEVLRRMRPDLMLAWLAPARGYLERHGWEWPAAAPAGVGPVDYERLAGILAGTDGAMPLYLADSLFVIQEMANDAGLELMIARAEAQGFAQEFQDVEVAIDVALRFWLCHPGELEDLHNSRELGRPRAFQYFAADPASGTRDAGSAPFEPAADSLLAFERRIDAYHQARRGGGKGARVFCYPVGEESWFLVRHPAPCRRELALEDGEPRPVLYKPQRYDVLRYNPAEQDVGVRCCSALEQRTLLRVFGSCFFGRPDYFPGTAKYTLAPLLLDGRDSLACADVPGLERVRLTRVEFYCRQPPWSKSSHQAEDIFSVIEHGDLRWPGKLEDVTRATFEIKFRRSRRPRSLTLVPCNKALYGRDEDSRWLELWLQARRFMIARQNGLCRPLRPYSFSTPNS